MKNLVLALLITVTASLKGQTFVSYTSVSGGGTIDSNLNKRDAVQGSTFLFKDWNNSARLFCTDQRIFDVENTLRPNNYNSLSAGLEWMTNGHNFKIVLTNSRGFTESQFIPYTYSNWLNNEFRLGFSITRNFKI